MKLIMSSVSSYSLDLLGSVLIMTISVLCSLQIRSM